MVVPEHMPQTPSCAPGPKTFAYQRYAAWERRLAHLLYPEASTPYWRPRTRADCKDVPRPCPYIGCRYHLYLEVTQFGSIKYNKPGEQPWDIDPANSCALDIADREELTLERTGAVLNVTRERTRQVQEALYETVRHGVVHLRILTEDDPEDPRPLPDRSPRSHE